VFFYRIVARNGSGASRPSNVVGPVRVARACLADELRDFSLAHEKSEGLALTNEFNALYAEHLFRAKGGAGDWLSYRVPDDIATVRIVAFGEAAPRIEIEFPGASPRAAPEARRRERLLQPMSGGLASKQRRVMLELETAAPAGARLVRIRWLDSAELDRVEIRHAPAAP
jgi:hypothetical protein